MKLVRNNCRCECISSDNDYDEDNVDDGVGDEIRQFKT